MMMSYDDTADTCKGNAGAMLQIPMSIGTAIDILGDTGGLPLCVPHEPGRGLVQHSR